MKLKCPSCAAEYKVAAAMVGSRGRMVRCVSCGAEWFQAAGVDDEPVEAAAPEPAPDPVQEIAIDPVVSADPVIVMPEIEPVGRDGGYRLAPEETVVKSEEIYFDPEPEVVDETVDETRVRRRRDEDRDELSASLADINQAPPQRSGGAFLAGFSTIAVLAVIGLGVYVKAGDIALVAPGAEPALSAFIGYVDQGRSALAGLIG